MSITKLLYSRPEALRYCAMMLLCPAVRKIGIVEVTHNNVNSKHIANKAKAIALVDPLDTFVANNFAHLFTFTAKVHNISQTYSRCSQHIVGREKKTDRSGGFVIKTSSNVNTSAINRFNILIC